MQLEFHQLDRRLETLRVRHPARQRRLLASLATLPKTDIAEMIQDNQPLEIKCDGCGKQYVVTPAELLLAVAPDAAGGLFGGDGSRGDA